MILLVSTAPPHPRIDSPPPTPASTAPPHPRIDQNPFASPILDNNYFYRCDTIGVDSPPPHPRIDSPPPPTPASTAPPTPASTAPPHPRIEQNPFASPILDNNYF